MKNSTYKRQDLVRYCVSKILNVVSPLSEVDPHKCSTNNLEVVKMTNSGGASEKAVLLRR